MKTVFSKVMWAGRATVFTVGLAVVLAVMLGVATTAIAAAPGDPFRLGKANPINKLTKLVGKGEAPRLVVQNRGNGVGLRLLVKPGKPPMTVNSGAKVNRLNADQIDGRHAEQLTRVAFAKERTDALVGEDGTVLSTSITAPTDGFLVIDASSNVSNPFQSDILSCLIRVDGAPDVPSVRSLELNGDDGLNRHEDCSTDTVVFVGAGDHTVELHGLSVGSGSRFSASTLSALFVPFDAEGDSPVLAE